MIILAIFIMAIMILCIVSFSTLWVKNQTRVNGLIVWYFGLFAGAIMLDCIRVVVIFGFGEYYPELDNVAYVAKIIAIFIAFTLVSEIHITLSEYIGYPQKHISLLRYYLMAIAAICASSSVYWYYTTAPDAFGFYVYQLYPILYLAIFLAYLPVAVVIFFRNLYILRSVTKKSIYNNLLIFTILSFVLVGERGYNIGAYSLLYSFLNIPIELSLIVNFVALSILSFIFIFVILKYPNLMESIGTYFSIKKLYILKDNGLLIFNYDFEEKIFLDGSVSQESLIGGFIYAITEGLKDILKACEDINSVTSGDRSFVIERGEFVFGALIVTADSPLMHRKLIEFIKILERNYKKDLENWTGEFTKFEEEKIKKWIFKILREN